MATSAPRSAKRARSTPPDAIPEPPCALSGPDRFASIGAYGFAGVQTVLLAALVSEDPLLLIGRSGTGKTFLLNSISEALGLEHRHYNASLVSFDDLVGFPFPDDAREQVRFLPTPATVWGAESVLVDEISRCKPEHQNRLFSLIHERRIQGIALPSLRYRWAAMNPVSTDQSGVEDYTGSEPLDPALADRFAVIVEVGDWAHLDELQQRLVANPAGEGRLADDGGQLRADVAAWRERFLTEVEHCPQVLVEYARVAVSELNRAGARISPRRARLLTRTLLAATVVRGATEESECLAVLRCSLPQIAWGQAVKAEHVLAAHRLAWSTATSTGRDRWLHAFHVERHLARKVALLAEHCPDIDAGTLAVEQLLSHESPERAAAFSFVVYPAALAGLFPIGGEGLADLGKRALQVLHVEGELQWREPNHQARASHPEMAGLMAIVGSISHDPPRAARARQLFYWALLNKVTINAPAELEQELDAAVRYLGGRVSA
jgi:MoxR-like ATPase